MNGKKGHQVARIEAWEEAGVRGQAEKLPHGFFEYQKTLAAGRLEPCYVQVHRLAVAYVEAIFPEMSQRATRWFTPSEASNHVAEPALAAMLAAL